MSATLHAFDFLASEPTFGDVGICVVFGDEGFLKQQVLQHVKRTVLGAEETDMPVATFDGPNCQWRDVHDEISTLSLFGDNEPRIGIVADADSFVTKNRDRIEDYVGKSKTSGILVLDVTTWPSNTRLYKAIGKIGNQIDCRAPQNAKGRGKGIDERKIEKWLVQWAKSQHQISLGTSAASHLLDHIGPEFGLLDQSLAKLALFVDTDGKVYPEMIDDVVGGWRTKSIWDTIDAAIDGNAHEALTQLDHLFKSGDHPQALFGQISWSLRRFAAATEIFVRAQRTKSPMSLNQALQQAGFRDWPKGAIDSAHNKMKKMGRDRASKLYHWLLETDLALKGSHSQPERARFILEQLFIKVAVRPAQEPKAPATP